MGIVVDAITIYISRPRLIESESKYRSALAFLREKGIEVPRKEIYVGRSNELVLGEAVSFTTNLSHLAWDRLASSELSKRFGLRLLPSDIPVLLSDRQKGLDQRDLGDVDILLPSGTSIDPDMDNQIRMHELWHVLVTKFGKVEIAPLIFEGEAEYIGCMLVGRTEVPRTKASVDYFKFNVPARIISETLRREGRGIIDLLEDDSLRRRLNQEVEQFYQDPSKTPGYIFIPHIFRLVRGFTGGEIDITSREGLAKAYEDIGELRLAEVIRLASSVEKLLEGLMEARRRLG